MEELNKLVELLFKHMENTPSIEYLRNNYMSLVRFQQYIKENKIIPKMAKLSNTS